MAWTRFMDMHSGGDNKIEDLEYIYLEMSRKDAERVFEELFGQDPYEIACSCCGQNFSVSEYSSLEEATRYERGTKTVEAYCAEDYVRVIYAKELLH